VPKIIRLEERRRPKDGDLSQDEIMTELHTLYPWLQADGDVQLPTAHVQKATHQRAKPLNLVIVLQESLGATFVESLGGVAVTPELEKLKHQGWWFEQLYATGTRSVRGIEAVISGYPPTPARSVVKLSLSQDNFFTLAGLLGENGYFTEFIYGGEPHFDNMATFFLGNGFQSVIGQHDYENPVFEGSWGVSDEDLLNKTHQRIEELHARDKPFLVFAFSSSNHSPFEFPDGRIKLHDAEKQTVNNAVKYADYAVGQFFDKARNSDYWKDTLFLVVADHDIRVYGDSLVPIERFHIPGLILGADLEPKRITSIASQIDLAPTLLSLMGLNTSHPMIGRDMSAPEQQQSPGRALMQFENYFALMQGEGVTVLRPEKTALAGRYDFVSRVLTMKGEARPAARKAALAHSLLPCQVDLLMQLRSAQHPAARVGLKTQLFIVLMGFGRSQQHDHAFRFKPQPGFIDQLLADTLLLIGRIHGQIGKIGDVGEIGEGAGNAHQGLAMPGRQQQAGVIQHTGKNIRPVYRAPLTQSRTLIKVNGLGNAHHFAMAVFNHGQRDSLMREWADYLLPQIFDTALSLPRPPTTKQTVPTTPNTITGSKNPRPSPPLATKKTARARPEKSTPITIKSLRLSGL